MRALGLVLAAALGFLACNPRPAPFHGLPFIENDFDAAFARSQQAAVPLFVEVWAPW